MPNTRDRVTVKQTVYHQIAGQNPTSFESGFTIYLNDPEQVWQRSPKKPATKEWERIDCGWVEDCLMLIIRNESREYWLEYSYSTKGPGFWVPPIDHPTQRADVRIYPENVKNLLIRCFQGEAKYTIFAVPR